METPYGAARRLKWLSVKKDIEKDIAIGKYVAGDKIPTIDQLMELYGIGRSTAQRVLREMADDGLIICQEGRGSFVRPYVREKLKESHREAVVDGIAEAVFRALDSGLSAEEIERATANAIVEYVSK